MVHPSVPAILLTPICPHSLNFRCVCVCASWRAVGAAACAVLAVWRDATQRTISFPVPYPLNIPSVACTAACIAPSIRHGACLHPVITPEYVEPICPTCPFPCLSPSLLRGQGCSGKVTRVRPSPLCPQACDSARLCRAGAPHFPRRTLPRCGPGAKATGAAGPPPGRLRMLAHVRRRAARLWTHAALLWPTHALAAKGAQQRSSRQARSRSHLSLPYHRQRTNPAPLRCAAV